MNPPLECKETAPEVQEKRIVLLIIDAQVDFHEGGALAVPGSTEDSERIAALIDSCGDRIDDIVLTLDTHSKRHIAHAGLWQDRSGKSPPPFTEITNQDVVDGEWSARTSNDYPWLHQYAIWYTKQLEKSPSGFKLIIWPEHCLIGSAGHAVQPTLFAATQRWIDLRGRDTHTVLKGQNPLVEMYSALAAEVPLDDSAISSLRAAGLNSVETDEGTTLEGHSSLVQRLTGSDVGRLVVCGQALSHCVKCTVQNLLAACPQAASKIVLLRDGCSPVLGFQDAAEEFVKEVVAAGGQVMTCQQFVNLFVKI